MPHGAEHARQPIAPITPMVATVTVCGLAWNLQNPKENSMRTRYRLYRACGLGRIASALAALRLTRPIARLN